MERDAARARLVRMVKGEPELDDSDIEALLDLAARSDVYGVAPGEAGWTGTYDLNAAAAEGFRWKSSRAAGDFDFSADGASFSKGKVRDNLKGAADMYEEKSDSDNSSGTMLVTPAYGRGPEVVPIANL